MAIALSDGIKIKTEERQKTTSIDCGSVSHFDLPVPQSPVKAHSRAHFGSTGGCCVGGYQGM